jgi:hypothetical protein
MNLNLLQLVITEFSKFLCILCLLPGDCNYDNIKSNTLFKKSTKEINLKKQKENKSDMISHLCKKKILAEIILLCFCLWLTRRLSHLTTTLGRSVELFSRILVCSHETVGLLHYLRDYLDSDHVITT